MHILIIPSERFVPQHQKLEGIFQYHQAVILKEGGYKVGALSIQLSFSVPMIIKGFFYKVLGKKAGNSTDEHTIASLLKIGFTKFFHPRKYITREVLDGIIVYRIDALHRRPPVSNKIHLSWIKAGLICFDEYQKEHGRPDVIHAHESIYAGMLAEKIYKKYGIKYIITEHSSGFAAGTIKAADLERVRKAYSSATGLYAVSEAFAGLLNKLFSVNRFRYLPNVLDQHLEKFPYHPLENGHAKFIFLNIALFKPIKDQQTLIKAFKKVADANQNVELWIGGDGLLHDELKNLVCEKALIKSVRFLGVLNRDEVIKELQRCNCFVLSSTYETFGVVLIEAMLFGKPVIVTRCGVGQSIVTDKIGFIVDVNDEVQLAEAMLKVISIEKKYDPEYIRDFSIRNFGKEKFLQNMNKIYKEVV